MAKKTKLELTWIGKDQRPRLEPRVLVEDPARSYHADKKVTENDQFDNRLIFGDNLLALKALEQEFAGKIKCIYIDPPFNTGQAFDHYDDGIEHSLWLSLMRDRLEILHTLLATNGTIWVHLDDNEVHYLRIVMDEIFGRQCFVATVAWRAADSSNNDAKQFSIDHNTILVYSKEPGWLSYALPRTEESNSHYSNPDNDPKGPWFQGNVSSPHPRENLRFKISTPSGKTIDPPHNGWRWGKDVVARKIKSGQIVFSEDESRIVHKTYLADQKGLSPSSIWHDVKATGHNRQAKYELKKLFPKTPTTELFATPKPERLIERVLRVATVEGDLVLDSFAGSGTTGAVAHKMGRRWIMVELGNHCHEVIIPRLKKVIDGKDTGGITESVEWEGGGGFRYFTLAPSLLEKDQFDNWIINKRYNAELLAQAICKLEGFTYEPSETDYWQHGHSTESDFIYVTTQNLTRQQIEALSEEVGPNRSLLVFCSAYRIRNVDEFPNLTLRKIPKAVLTKCEWGKDDYSLEIKNLAPAEPEPDDTPPPPRKRKRKKANDAQQTLFAEEGADQ